MLPCRRTIWMFKIWAICLLNQKVIVRLQYLVVAMALTDSAHRRLKTGY